MLIGTLNFSSDLSNNFISLKTDGKLCISCNGHTLALKDTHRESMAYLENVFEEQGMALIPGQSKLLKPGEDVHFGGTIPIGSGSEGKLACKSDGSLRNFDRFYIADAAGLPKLAGKGNTFNSVVQSVWIARKF